MKHFLLNIAAPTGRKVGQIIRKDFLQSLTVLSILLLLCMSNTAFAKHHFKGGYFTYNPLGEGKYEILAISYWDTIYVGKVVPYYTNSPKILTFAFAESETLLPDGATVKKVQRQEIYLPSAGIYEVYWKTCCRGHGANFDHNETGMFAAINYDPAAPGASAQFYDDFNLNLKPGQAFDYRINMEHPEGVEQEFSLEIPYGLPADAYAELLEAGFQLKKDGTVHWENPVAGTWLVNVRLREKINGSYTGGYMDRDYILNVNSSDNNAPVFTPIQTQAVRAGESLSFEIEAVDAEGHDVALTANGSSFEKGAEFTQTVQGSFVKGTFTWTPPADAIGTYKVQFVATDNHSTAFSSYMNVAVTVAECTEFTPAYSIVRPCSGSSNGKITLSATEGVSPYYYSLDSGLTYQELADFENLAAGIYSAVIKDAIGCLSEPVNITLEEVPLPEVTLSLPTTVCANTGAMALSGGSPAGGIYEGTGVADGYFYPESAGVGTHIIYYTYTDSNGCSNTASDEITVNEAPLADAGADTVVYSGAGARSCTTLIAAATMGTAPYTYTWSTGETAQSIEVCPTETTTYVLTVTDASGCSDASQVTVTVQPPGNENRPDNVGKGSNQGWGASARSTTNLVDSFSIVEPLTAGITVFPNPITDKAQLKVALEEADWVRVDIIDLSGRVVQTLYTGNLGANQVLSFELNSQLLDSRNVYIARMSTTKGVHTVRLIVR